MDHYFHNLNDNRALNRPRNDAYFVFHTDSLSLTYAHDMINQVPSGFYILIYSSFSNDHLWPNAFKQNILQLGADTINQLQNYQPWIFFCRKGDPSSALEEAGDSVNIDVSLTALMGGNWYRGFITSELIGPATKWTGLHWGYHSIENPNQSRDSGC